MNDYGFITIDPKAKNKKGIIDARSPIFGVEYANMKKAFKTYHLIDLKTANISTTEPALSNPTYDTKWVIKKELVLERGHGYNFRPVGYVTFVGTIVRNIRSQLSQTAILGPDWTSNLGGNFMLRGAKSKQITLLPRIQGGTRQADLGGIYSDFNQIIFRVGKTPNADIQTPDACMDWFDMSYELLKGNTNEIFPYSFEITDKYVRIYHNIINVNIINRNKGHDDSFPGMDYDVSQRLSIAIDYAGSGVDATVYLCPYRMDDLV